MKKTVVLLFAFSLMACAHSQQASKPATPAPTSSPAPATAKTAPADAAKPAPAKPSESAEGTQVTCEKGKDSRVLAVVKKDKGCALEYTKSGNKSDVATSKNGTKHCEDAQGKIRGKLETAGFKCK